MLLKKTLYVLFIGIILLQCTAAIPYQKYQPKLFIKQHTIPTIYQPYTAYKKVPVYKYEKYPIKVPVKLPIYIKLKHSYGPTSISGSANEYDHEYHGSKSYGNNCTFVFLGGTGRHQYNNNHYDDSDYKQVKRPKY